MATCIVKLHAFSGAQAETPPCYLLQIDEYKFLLDCGWDSSFKLEHMEVVKEMAKDVDVILLSHSDPYYLGGLPYLVGKCGFNAAIYSTVPVRRMGQMMMYDLHAAHHSCEEFNTFSLDDIDLAFDKIHQLKYQQTVTFEGKGHGISITPLPAGHSLGATLWKIVAGEEEIVYSVGYNHKKERHMNGASFDLTFRPSLLITDCMNVIYAQKRRRARDEQLMTTILRTLRDGGNVLVATDTAGRCLELTYLLEQLWQNQDSGLMAYSLALLSHVAHNVVEHAKSQVEWMSDRVTKQFEQSRDNPFNFRYMQLCHSAQDLAHVREPRVVIASQADMDWGFTRNLFVQTCTNPKSSVILTQRCLPGSLARYLIDNKGVPSVRLEMKKRVLLEGEELEEYMLEKQKEKAEEAMDHVMDLTDDLSDEDEELADEVANPALQTGAAPTHQAGPYDILLHNMLAPGGGASFPKAFKRGQLVYPLVENKPTWDEYGEPIDPNIFLVLLPGAEKTESKLAPADHALEPVKKGHRDRANKAEEEEAPTKCIIEHVEVSVRSSIHFIDFEGRSDGEAVRKIVSTFRPREIVIIHGNLESTNFLAEFCRTNMGLAPDRIHTPASGDVVDVTKEAHIYQVRVKDSLISSLTFYPLRDYELAWVDAQVMFEGKHATLVPIKTRAPEHTTVFVGEPKLYDVKQKLQDMGMTAEFHGGVLIVNARVAVLRTEAGKLLIEGAFSEDYFRVRDLIYQQYAIL